ncbi:hypothetical protein FRB90_008046 [Tulasnella sp. 427]|nr:hypothetical protein FRB90_008046 [Tulasnella sp. 427]
MSVGSKSDSGSYRSAVTNATTGEGSGGWTTWRSSQWDSLRKHVSTQRRQTRQLQQHPQPQHVSSGTDPTSNDVSHDTVLLHTVSSDLVALNKLSDHIKRLKKELLQLKQWEEIRLSNLLAGLPPPPPLSFLTSTSSSTDTPTDSKKSKHRKMPSVDQDSRRHQPDVPRDSADSPNSSDETEKPESINEKIEEKKRQLKAAQDAERARRREMARKVANGAERVKQEQRRRVHMLVEYERELARKEQERVRAREAYSDARSAGHRDGNTNRTAPSSAHSGSPFRDLHGDYFTDIPFSATATPMPVDPSREVRYRAAWSRYAAGWARITGKLPSAPTQYTFATFPWPTIDPPSTLLDLKKETILDFMSHAPIDFHLSTKLALHEAVRRWHPDRSASVWTNEGIVAEQEKLMVKKGADIVIRVLNQLSADEKEVRRCGRS